MTTTQDILDIFLESSASSNTRARTQLAREVLKKKKSKKENNSSRTSSEELEGLDFVPSCLAVAQSLGSSQEAIVNMITPATTSSREITGITAQHVKTQRGIKVSVSIQTQSDVALGTFASLTAELKRHSRLRELKRYAGDSAVFEEHYISTINSLKELDPNDGRTICCGRLHERGKRAAWLADMMVVGTLDVTGSYLERIYLYYGLEEYLIEMNQELSERQCQGYHRAGVYGQIQTQTQVPTLATITRRTF